MRRPLARLRVVPVLMLHLKRLKQARTTMSFSVYSFTSLRMRNGKSEMAGNALLSGVGRGKDWEASTINTEEGENASESRP